MQTLKQTMADISASLPSVTEDTIRAIWSAHQLGPVTHITKPLGGVRNLCFFVNDSLVVRFNTHDPGSAKFHSERLAYELLGQQSFPVPQVLILDDSHTLAPYDFSITTRLPGRSLAHSWQFLSAEQLRTLIYEIGQYLARMHACTFPAFGKLPSLSYTSWASYVSDYVERYLRSANDMHLLDAELRISIEHIRDRAMRDFADVAPPALVHCDFHYENVLHVNGQLSGILDFEWALAGDPSYDFMIADVRERMVPMSEVILLAGYQSIGSLSANHQARVQWYQLFLQLEDVVTYQRMGDNQSALRVLQGLRQFIDRVKQ
jgi:aminoglycoside phosphotransferase (APT) family kinase protein